MDKQAEVVELQAELEQVSRVAAIDIAKASAMVCTRVPGDRATSRRLQRTWPVAAHTGAVAELADHVCVMRHGKIVEAGPTLAVLTHPQHPYTQALLDALPSRSEPGTLLAGGVGSDVAPPPRAAKQTPPATADAVHYVRIDHVAKRFAQTPGLFGKLAQKAGLSKAPAAVQV